LKLLELLELFVKVDLGSGNGEIIVTAAVETGIQADGFELNWVSLPT